MIRDKLAPKTPSLKCLMARLKQAMKLISENGKLIECVSFKVNSPSVPKLISAKIAFDLICPVSGHDVMLGTESQVMCYNSFHQKKKKSRIIKIIFFLVILCIMNFRWAGLLWK